MNQEVPRHIAIVMDGNGRWAVRRGMPRSAGHRAVARVARNLVERASELDVECLTLFAFSSENWHRPPREVRVLLDLFLRTIRREIAELRANGVRLHFVGERRRFSAALQRNMRRAEELTAANKSLDLVIAVDYGGRWDIVQAARRLAEQVERGELGADQVDDDRYARMLSLSAFPPPDLFIRTGGERRLSNFLLWDLAYTEMYFSDILWPDFDGDRLSEAVDWYLGRERRFGRISARA